MTKEITLEKLAELAENFTILDNSPRGATTKRLSDIKIGDSVIIDNYAAVVTK